MMRPEKSRSERRASFQVQRIHAASRKLIPITRELPRYLELSPHAAKRKSGERGSGKGRAVKRAAQKHASSSFHPPVVPRRGMRKLWEPRWKAHRPSSQASGVVLPTAQCGMTGRPAEE